VGYLGMRAPDPDQEQDQQRRNIARGVLEDS
jgi:hypothetical protein